jgi:single-stranded DNA-binding protein
LVPTTLWDRQAQAAARYLDKGSRVAVEGRLHVDFVAVRGAAEGEVRRSRLAVEVVVDRITYLSPIRRPADASADEVDDSKPVDGRRSGR